MSPQTTAARPLQVAVLDDYQGIAAELADWSALPAGSTLRSFRDHLSEEAALVARLAPFDVIVAMRERTPFPRTLLAQLPQLHLLITTGLRNAAIDLRAAADHGITVCGTEGLPYPTAELTWGLLLALARHIPAEDRALREGRWQTSVGVGLHGKTLAVLGLGRLGTQVARIGAAFGMQVIAWSPNLSEARASAVVPQLLFASVGRHLGVPGGYSAAPAPRALSSLPSLTPSGAMVALTTRGLRAPAPTNDRTRRSTRRRSSRPGHGNVALATPGAR